MPATPKTIDQLDAAAALTGAEKLHAMQAGKDVRVLISDLITAVLASADASGTATSALAAHLAAFTHGDITHANRTALDLISGANTGDQDLSPLAPKNNPLFEVGIRLPNASSGDTDTLDWYKENAWVPSDVSGANLTLTYSNCNYTRIGNMLFLSGTITYPATADATTAAIGGLPFDPAYAQNGVTNTPALTYGAVQAQPGNKLQLFNVPGTGARTNAALSGITVSINLAIRI